MITATLHLRFSLKAPQHTSNVTETVVHQTAVPNTTSACLAMTSNVYAFAGILERSRKRVP